MTQSNGQLKAFVERIERIEEEIKSGNDDKRDIYAEAKGEGWDVKALKTVIARRRKDPAALTEHEALVETYEAALGTPVATRVHAHDGGTVLSKLPTGPTDTLIVNDDGLEIPDYLKRKRATA